MLCLFPFCLIIPSDLHFNLKWKKPTVFFYAFIGVGVLGVVAWALINMHQHGHLCFAPRQKKADEEYGRALSEIQSSHRASDVTLVNFVNDSVNEPTTIAGTVQNQFNHVMDSTNEPVTSAGTVHVESETQNRREPRRFEGKKDLKPFQLADKMRNDIDAVARSARVTRQEREKQREETDTGTVKIQQSVR